MRINYIVLLILLATCNCINNPVNPFSSEEGFIVCTMYDNESGYRQVFKLDLDGNIIKKITNQRDDVDYVRFNPTGEWVAFSLHFKQLGWDRKKLGVVNIESLNESIFDSPSGRIIGWSPSNDLILTYTQNRVFVTDIKGNIVFSENLGYPQFYKTNDKLIYITSNYIDYDYSFGIFTYSLFSEEDNFLGFFDPFRSYEYYWDENKLVYESLNNELHILNLDTSEEFIYPKKAYTDAPKWSNDGNYIIYVGYQPPSILSETYNSSHGIIILSDKGELVKVIRPGNNLVCADIFIK